MLDAKKIREDFPILNKPLKDGKRIVYLDNAATTQKPKQVIEALKEFYEEKYSNVHRGHHYLSQKSSEIYEEAHEKVAKFLGSSSWEEIVFTFNTTSAINYLSPSVLELMKKRGKRKIIISIMEHHSNMLPWRRAAPFFGMHVVYAPIKQDGSLDMKKLFELIDEDTAVIAISHASNVTGIINDIKAIAREAHKYDSLVVVDGAQSVPHLKINVKNLEIDFLTFSGHKMLAPEGTGGFYGKKELLEEMKPWISGGGSIKDVTLKEIIYANLPWKFEPGTPNISGSMGLIKAIEYLEKIGMEKIHLHEKRLLEYIINRLKEQENITYYQKLDPEKHTGIFSFNINGINPHIVGQLLNDFYNIAIRTGLHCAHPYHYALGAKDGTARASFYIYNDLEDMEILGEAIETIIRKYSHK